MADWSTISRVLPVEARIYNWLGLAVEKLEEISLSTLGELNTRGGKVFEFSVAGRRE